MQSLLSSLFLSDFLLNLAFQSLTIFHDSGGKHLKRQQLTSWTQRKASLTAAAPGVPPWYLSTPATICIRRLWLVLLISPKSHPAAVYNL